VTAAPEDKIILRQKMLAKRLALSDAMRAQAASAFQKEFMAAVATFLSPDQVLAFYQPMRHELDVTPLISQLAEDQKIRLALPALNAREALVFKSWEMNEPLHKGRFGQAEPDLNNPDVMPDIIITPLLAFDEKGHRLGYGKGHYDGAIARLKKSKSILTVGAAYECQKLASLPAEAHDERLDMVITEQSVYRFQK
jgi:5-formyltetrahydrofolate cyclo-ligase